MWDTAICLPMDKKDLKWIVFSDHHRGRRDRADDFLRCESAYINALNHYLKEGYNLVLLGDVEEFWENPFYKVINSYEKVLNLEKQFYDKGNLIKLWGNHDESWQFPIFVSKRLKKYFPKIKAHEGITLRLTDDDKELGQILFVHGHQGSNASDKFAKFSKFFVRYFWRNIQVLFNMPLSTPSNNMGLKSAHDKEMYEWASSKEKQVLVCGHTHQPVFLSRTHLDELELKKKEILTQANDIPDAKVEEKITKIEKKKQEIDKPTHLNATKDKISPCYFNSGCCSFSDGDITGLELTEDAIKLVKWNKEKRVEHRSEKWENVFKKSL